MLHYLLITIEVLACRRGEIPYNEGKFKNKSRLQLLISRFGNECNYVRYSYKVYSLCYLECANMILIVNMCTNTEVEIARDVDDSRDRYKIPLRRAIT